MREKTRTKKCLQLAVRDAQASRSLTYGSTAVYISVFVERRIHFPLFAPRQTNSCRTPTPHLRQWQSLAADCEDACTLTKFKFRVVVDVVVPLFFFSLFLFCVSVRANVSPGTSVEVVQKQDQRTGRLTSGTVGRLLTSSGFHPRGIKV